MILEDFKKLTITCDTVICRFLSSTTIVANPWLHVINGHPENLVKYQALSEKKQIRPYLIKLGLGLIRFALRLFKSLTQKVQVDTPIIHKADVLFFSHIVNKDIDPEATDFYFGDLPAELEKDGTTTFIAYINHLEVVPQWFTKNTHKTFSKYVIPKVLSFFNEILLFVKCGISHFKILLTSIGTADPWQKRVLFHASSHAHSSGMYSALVIQHAARMVITKLRPSVIVLTWEGHSWERLIFKAARDINPMIKCIGYQHAILPPTAHAIKRSLGTDYDPDLILTIGKITADILMKAISTDVRVFGSYKRTGTSGPNSNKPGDKCLVTPEGLESECIILFDFAIRAAFLLPDINFIFRNHPVLPFTSLLDKHPHLRNLPPNCSLSSKDLNADFVDCSWLLYRGSSVSIYSMLAGLRPIYLELANELSLDPLYTLTSWRRTVSEPSGFAEIVKSDQLTPKGLLDKELASATEFARNYVFPPDYNAFKKYAV